jgi:two-component system, NarL family, sensor histidine kinase UhpB
MIDTLPEHIFEGAATGIVICSSDGRFLCVNPAYCEITGYAASELLALDYQAITHPDDAEREAEVARGLLSGRSRHFDLEKRYVRKDGDVRWVRVSGSVVPGGGGASSLLAVVEDLTTRKRAEEALRAAQRRLERLADAARAAEDAARRALGRRLHDRTAQSLTALSMNLAALETGAGARQDALVAAAAEAVDACNREIRILSHLLDAIPVDRADLAVAMEVWLRGFARRTGIAMGIRIDPAVQLSRAAAYAVCRIVQEVLTEVSGRSRSEAVTVELQCQSDAVVLEILWDGAMLEAAWFGLQERAELAGGSIEAASGRNGTGLRVRIPGEPGNAYTDSDR